MMTSKNDFYVNHLQPDTRNEPRYPTWEVYSVGSVKPKIKLSDGLAGAFPLFRVLFAVRWNQMATSQSPARKHLALIPGLRLS